MATTAGGTAEADAALLVAYGLKQRKRCPLTLVADRAYDRPDLLKTSRELGVMVHAAQRSRGSALERRTTRHTGYEVSQW